MVLGSRRVKLARDFARKKHSGQIKKDGITTVYDHLGSVVRKLNRIGIIDESVQSAAWLHDVLESTDTSFDELESLFGRKTTSLVLSLTKDYRLSKDVREKHYLKQLKESSLNAKMVKLCDIASNLEDIHNSKLSQGVKAKKITKILGYLDMIKKDVLENSEKYPRLYKMMESINEITRCYNQELTKPKNK